jgi:hypothetical protein
VRWPWRRCRRDKAINWRAFGFHERREPTPAEQNAIFGGWYDADFFDDDGHPWVNLVGDVNEAQDLAIYDEIVRRIQARPRDPAAEKRIDASTFALAKEIQ